MRLQARRCRTTFFLQGISCCPPTGLSPLMELTPHLLQLATQALDLVLDFKRPADAVLSAFFREHKKLGSHDRAFVAEAVFGVLRR